MPRADEFANDPYVQDKRKDPVALFRNALETLFADNTPEETLAMWRTFCAQPTPFAANTLYAIEAVIANPPDNLGEMIREHGWVFLETDETDDGIATDEQYLAWLKETAATFRDIYEAAAPR